MKQQINQVALKINKANAMTSKLRHVLDIKSLRSAYYAIFESHLCYASFVWVQNTNSVKRLRLLQKKISQNNVLSKQKFPYRSLSVRNS